ncbi:MAG: DUF4136 domain-containing protein [Pseudomonadota bacterium]
MKRAIALVALSTILLGACASGPSYRTDYDSSANFATYKTYGFFDELGTDQAGYSSLITQHFKNALRREMDALGYTYSQNEPDLLVNFFANAEQKSEVRTRQTPTPAVTRFGYYGYRRGLYATYPLYTTEVETVNYQTGTANIDLVDRASNQLVWEGVAEGRLSREAMSNPRPVIDAIVAELIARFATIGQ